MPTPAEVDALLLGPGGPFELTEEMVVFFAVAALGLYRALVCRTVAGEPTGYVLRRDRATTDDRG